MPINRFVFADAIAALEVAASEMASAVPRPQLVTTAGGHRSYRYIEKTLQQAIVLKVVRTISALRALAVLVDAGLLLDAGACMRVLDELGTDTMFLAGPSRTGRREPRHDSYVAELFQEEFDHADPLQSTQRRHRVSRSDIRAYVSRTYASMAGISVSAFSEVAETIESSVSGYVHGAAVHILDVYDGSTFVVPIPRGERPLVVVERQFEGYLFRAMAQVMFGALALGLPTTAQALSVAAQAVPTD